MRYLGAFQIQGVNSIASMVGLLTAIVVGMLIGATAVHTSSLTI